MQSQIEAGARGCRLRHMEKIGTNNSSLEKAASFIFFRNRLAVTTRFQAPLPPALGKCTTLYICTHVIGYNKPTEATWAAYLYIIDVNRRLGWFRASAL